MTPGSARTDRRILTAATALFARHGYAAVGIDDIAAAVGATGPAIYRHHPSKYALLHRSTTATAERLARAAAEPGPRAEFPDVARALLRSAMPVRTGVGSLRRNRHHLRPEDRTVIDDRTAVVTAAVQAAARRFSDTVDPYRVGVATLAVVSSVGTHRTASSTRRVVDLLTEAIVTAATTPPPAVAHPSPVERGGLAPATRRQRLLDAAAALFAEHGVEAVTVRDITGSVDLAPATLYRYFRSRSDVLDEVCLRAAQRSAERMSTVLAESESPREAVSRLVDAVTADLLSRPASAVLRLEYANVGDPVRRTVLDLLTQERAEWSHLLRSIRPELTSADTRFLVAAASATAHDLARGAAVPESARAAVVLATLLGPAAT